MALARARALRSLPTSLRNFSTRTLAPRVSAPARTALRVQRRYASGGAHGAEESSDVPWAIGAVVVTIPACWYLWPESGHADHHGGHGHGEEHGEEHEEEEGGEEKSADGGEEEGQDGGEEKSEEKEDGGEDKSSDDADNKQEDKAAEPQESTKDSDGSTGESSSPAAGEQSSDTPPTDEQETTPGGGGGKDDETEVQQKSNERKIKKKPDSGQELGASDQSQVDNSNDEDGPSKENAATAKEPEKGKSGEISGKQFGLSTGPTKHTLPIDSDPNKSKKGEGTPETAKAMGTVDSNRPAR